MESELIGRAMDAWYVDGDAEAALDGLSRAGDGVERWAIEARVRAELGEHETARAALQRALDNGGADHVEVVSSQGALQLATWQVDEAIASFLHVAEQHGVDPWLLERLAVAADLQGDFERADELLAQAHALDPEGSPLPPRLSHAAFLAVVEEAAGDLPEEFRRYLHEVPVVVDPMPTGPMSEPPEVLGLFLGFSLAERDPTAGGELPPTIYLYQRNLERAVRDAEELREEIRVTLYHELGHLLGFDEDGVDDLGLA